MGIATPRYRETFTTKYQKKSHDLGTITSNQLDIAELRFSNLEIGKKYRVKYAGEATSLSDNQQVVFYAQHDGVTIAQSRFYYDSDDTPSIHFGASDYTIFIATTTTVTFNVGLNNATPVNVEANVILEEDPNLEETTQWT